MVLERDRMSDRTWDSWTVKGNIQPFQTIKSIRIKYILPLFVIALVEIEEVRNEKRL